MIAFSILTPTWNRQRYLERVHRGLMSQTYRNFEWIVADDGSMDETRSVIDRLSKISDFKIVYIHANRHIGKAVMDNQAVRHAESLLTLWCDSDDILKPDALQRLWDTWNTIPVDLVNEYVGLTALVATQAGCVANPLPSLPYTDVRWNELSEIYHVTGDMLFCARTSVLKKNPFPEVDFVIPESVVWTTVGEGKTRLIPEILKEVEYRADHAISFSETMAYNRGRAYSLAVTTRNLSAYRRSFKFNHWRLVTYVRYCLHGEIEMSEAIKLWMPNLNHVVFWAAFLFAWGLALIDRVKGKVRYTHREFLLAQPFTQITIEILN